MLHILISIYDMNAIAFSTFMAACMNNQSEGEVTLSKSRVNAWITHKILTRYISDLRISSVFLTWNLRSCAPMFAGSALYTIPGFEQLKTRLRVRVYAVLRCFTYFCVVCVVRTRTMREICVEYQWSFAKMLPLSRSSTTFQTHDACFALVTPMYHWKSLNKITGVCMRAYAMKCVVC